MNIQKLLEIIEGQKTVIFFESAIDFKIARIAIEARSDIKAYFDILDSRTELISNVQNVETKRI